MKDVSTLLERLREDFKGKNIAKEWSKNRVQILKKYNVPVPMLRRTLMILEGQIRHGYKAEVKEIKEVKPEVKVVAPVKEAPKKKAAAPKKAAAKKTAPKKKAAPKKKTASKKKK